MEEIILLKNNSKCLSFKKGYSLIESIVAVTIFTIIFTVILFVVVNIVKLETISKNKIYDQFKETNKISEKYYIKNQ